MNSHSRFNYIIRDKHVRLQYPPSVLNSSSSSASSTGTSPFYGSETPPGANTASSSHSSSLQPFLTSTSCVCPPGFKQNQGGPQQGCVRKTEFTNSIKFLKLDYVNYTSTNMESMDARNFTICESTWRANSRCLGFGYEYDGAGFCSMVLGELRHGYWSPGTEASLFLKLDRSETDASKFTGMIEVLQTSCLVRISFPPLTPKDSNSTARNIAIICKLFAAKLISGVAFFWSFIKRYIKYRDMATTLGLEFLPAGGPKCFSYAELKTATKDFSNLIGRAGFGDVYKGQLPDHRVVAVKWLKNVTGSHREFWAEVTVQKFMED